MKHRFIAKKYWKEELPPMSMVAKLAGSYEDVIDLSLGDPDYITHRLIIDRAYEDTLKGHTRYTDARGDVELREEIIRYYKEDFDYELADEELFITASATHGMCLAFCSILDPGDEVIIPAPYYTYYTDQIRFAGGVPVILDCLEEDGFQIDVLRLETLITERTKAILINTPNNPSGVCMTREKMEQVAELVIRYDLVAVADDIYTAYSFQEPFIPIMTLPGMRERTITIGTVSKDYAMTGWRVGHIAAPPELIRTILTVNDAVMYTASSVSQRAAIHAIRNRKAIQTPMIQEYKKRVFYTSDRIQSMKHISVLPPQGTFYLWVNVKKLGMTSVEVSDLLLKKAHVLTVPGISFGECGEGYVRIACTKELSVLKEAMDRLECVPELNG